MTHPTGPAGPAPQPPDPGPSGPGRTHLPAGRLNGISAPIGTLLGPKAVTREYVVVTGQDECGVSVGYVRADESFDLDAPRSVAEHRLAMRAQQPIRARLHALFGRA